MNVENLFKAMNSGDAELHKKSIKQLGQLYRMWEEDDTFVLVKETINREIALSIDQTDISESLDKNAMTFAYVKGLKNVLNRLEWYKLSAEEIIRQEKENDDLESDMINEDNKFIAGLEAGPDSGMSSLMR